MKFITDRNCPPTELYEADASMVDSAISDEKLEAFWSAVPPTWRIRLRWRWFAVRAYFIRLWGAVLNRDEGE